MKTSLLAVLFNRASRTVSSRPARRKAPSTAKLRFENLESRELLSVSPADYETLRQTYDELVLPLFEDANVVELDVSSPEALQAAIAEACASPQDDVLVLNSGAQFDLSATTIAIDAKESTSGSISLVTLGDEPATVVVNNNETTFDILNGAVRIGGANFVKIGSLDAPYQLAQSLALDAEQTTWKTQNVAYYDVAGKDVSDIFADDFQCELAKNQIADYFAPKQEKAGVASNAIGNDYAVVFIGGGSASSNAVRYYNTLVELYNVLTRNCKLVPENIYILYADGDTTGTSPNREDGTPSDMTFATALGTTVQAANRNTLSATFRELNGKMNADSHLLFWTYDHGSGTSNAPTNYNDSLVGWNDWLSGAVVRDALFQIKQGYVTCAFGQCYSGGVLDDILDPATGQVSSAYVGSAHFSGGAAVNHYEVSWTGTSSRGHSGYIQSFTRGLRLYQNNYDVYEYAIANNPYLANEVYPNNGGTWVDGAIEHSWHVGESFDVFSVAPSPATWTVTSAADSLSDKGSLRYILSVAEDGDSILFDGSLDGATITLNGEELKISKSISLAARDADGNALNIRVDGAQTSEIFSLSGSSNSPISVSISGLDLLNGGGYYGGGIYANYANLTLADSSITNGVVMNYGGGVCAYNSTITLTNCEVGACSSNMGGGLFMYNSTLTAVDSKIFNSQSGYGGGVYGYSSSLTLTNCYISNCSSSGVGGGIYLSESASATLEQCVVVENASDWGGGIETYGTIEIYSSTISRNSGRYGGGVRLEGDAARLSIYNSIVAENEASYSESYADVVKASGSSVAYARNVLTTFNAWSDGESVYAYASDQPLFWDAASGDYTLANNSQAVDKGNDAYARSTRDLAGKTRVLNDAIDLGAYEYQGWTQKQLARPTLTSSTKSSSTITVNWNAISLAKSYTISYAVKSDSPEYRTATLGASKTSYVLRDLDPETSYYIKIRANGDGVEHTNSQQSPTITVKTFKVHQPLEKPSVSATSTASAITLNWDVVDYASGYAIDFNGTTYGAGASKTSYTFTGLTYLTSYSFSVRAVGNGDSFLDSENTTLTVKTKALQQLERPEITSAVGTSSSEILVQWATVPNAKSYTISYAVKSTEPAYQTATLGATKTSYTLRNLEAYTNYYIKIRANGDNIEYSNSAQSSTVTARSLRPKLPLDAPTLAAEATASTITLTWDAVPNASGYAIDFRGTTYTVGASETSYSFSGLKYSTSYTFVARALGDDVRNLDSPDVALTVKTTPLQQLPRPALTATPTSSSTIDVSWATVPGAKSYTISYAVKSATPQYQTATLGATKTSYTLRNLEAYTNYYVKICANGDNIEYKTSPQSPTATAKTLPIQQLTRPALTVTATGATTINVAWETIPNAKSYTISYAVKSTEPVYQTVTLGASKTSYMLRGLDPNTSYYIKIRANADGLEYKDSQQSPTVTARTTAAASNALLDAAFEEDFDEFEEILAAHLLDI